MRFLALCLGVSALAVTSVAVLSVLQSQTTARPPAPPEPREEPPRAIGRRSAYPLGFSAN